MESIKSCLRNYAKFKGRASTSEFVWFWIIGSLVVSVLVKIQVTESLFSNLGIIAWISLLIPSLAVGSRRMHDTNRSAWLFIVGSLAIFGLSLFAFDVRFDNFRNASATQWACFIAMWAVFFRLFSLSIAASTPGPNRFGPSPHEVTP
jgi:uncharacterized membrane protein YhaH (DUF805 family)